MSSQEWEVCAADNQIYTTTFEGLKYWIETGRVISSTKIRTSSMDWTEAQHIPALRECFNKFSSPTPGWPAPVQQPYSPPAQQQFVAHHMTYNPHMQQLANTGMVMCRVCGYNGRPYIERKVSTVGWAVFVALLVLFFPLCWIAVFIKEDVAKCANCRNKLK